MGYLTEERRGFFGSLFGGGGSAGGPSAQSEAAARADMFLAINASTVELQAWRTCSSCHDGRLTRGRSIVPDKSDIETQLDTLLLTAEPQQQTRQPALLAQS